MVEISKEVIKAYALENALKYGGKASQGAVLSCLFAEGLEKSEIKDHIPKIQEVLNEIGSMSFLEQKKAFEPLEELVSKRELREGLLELPNAEKGKVVMRLAPFPSGPLHIGNARGLILNDEYVKMYKGKLILVMDDTIGSVDKPIEKDAYKMIEEGVKWLGVDYDKKIIYKSDRIEKYYAYAEEMIKKGYIYVCNCSSEEIQNLRAKGIACSCRQFSNEEQVKRWKQMFTAEEGSTCARLKTNMDDPDPAFRDRVMFRISDRPHARTGKKYRVYPLLDFAFAIDDHLLGVTHILRGMDLVMETRVEKFIWDIFKWKHPEVIYHGHFAIKGVKLSKSKGAQEVKSGIYNGWNDPRTWSLQSLRDRGISPEAIREFILGMGIKKTKIVVPVDVIYSLDRKRLENSKRYFFVENPEGIRIGGCPEINAKLPLHPSGEQGFREYLTTQEFYISRRDFESMVEGNYRLMHLLNFKVDHIIKLKPKTFSFISENPEKELKAKYIQWLPVNVENVDVEVVMPDGSVVRGLGEPELSKLIIGTVVQFERFGFVRLHKKDGDWLEFRFAHT
ncbi:MAG: glutamate--tRNA ligase [archaeon]|nr:glutamate--tRNA ligase [archaeon]MCR4323622.1 glutamate--tRNA ligase [Nanoarchaeota archaeon]